MAHGTERGHAPETHGRTIGWWAPFYDVASWAMSLGQEPAIRRRTIAAAALTPGEKVLDVGCGTGRLALKAWEAVRPDGEVYGIDASEKMIEVARNKVENAGVPVRFQLAAIEDLPFAEGEFDVVLSTFMMHHLPDDLKAKGFKEAARVLAPGGRLLVVDLADSTRSLLGRLTGIIGHSMPEGYVAGLKSGMGGAALENVEELPSRYGYLAFIKATKGAAQ